MRLKLNLILVVKSSVDAHPAGLFFPHLESLFSLCNVTVYSQLANNWFCSQPLLILLSLLT